MLPLVLLVCCCIRYKYAIKTFYLYVSYCLYIPVSHTATYLSPACFTYEETGLFWHVKTYRDIHILFLV